MIGKLLGAILWLTSLGSGCFGEDAPVVSVISWQGSAFKDGDAFNVAVTISEKEAQFFWDGFALPGFDFLDEKENPRIRKEFLFRDEATVKALQIIAEQAEQCDGGSSGVIGQGVSVTAMVQSPPGKIHRDIHYFGTPYYKTKARRFEKMPWDLKEMLIESKVEEEVPPTSGFSQNLRVLAEHLDTYGKALRALTEAYKSGGDLPRRELEKVCTPMSLEGYLAIDRRSAEESGSIKRGLPVLEAILNDCLNPSHRALLCGEGAGDGGVILNIAKCHGDRWVEHPLLKMEVSASDCPVGMLSYEGKAFLLHFLMGFRSHRRMDASDVCEFVVSKEGKVEIRQSDQIFPGFPDLPDLPDTAARLKYLNDKNLCGVLLGLNASPEKRVAIVTIAAVTVNPENADQARIDFLLEGEERILEVSRADGKWRPGKLWNWGDYFQIDGVYHSENNFPPEGR